MSLVNQLCMFREYRALAFQRAMHDEIGRKTEWIFQTQCRILSLGLVPLAGIRVFTMPHLESEALLSLLGFFVCSWDSKGSQIAHTWEVQIGAPSFKWLHICSVQATQKEVCAHHGKTGRKEQRLLSKHISLSQAWCPLPGSMPGSLLSLRKAATLQHLHPSRPHRFSHRSGYIYIWPQHPYYCRRGLRASHWGKDGFPVGIPISILMPSESSSALLPKDLSRTQIWSCDSPA
jgi:hypothetical protein